MKSDLLIHAVKEGHIREIFLQRMAASFLRVGFLLKDYEGINSRLDTIYDAGLGEEAIKKGFYAIIKK